MSPIPALPSLNEERSHAGLLTPSIAKGDLSALAAAIG